MLNKQKSSYKQNKTWQTNNSTRVCRLLQRDELHQKNDCHKWIIHFTRHWNEWRLTTLPKSDNGSQFVRIRGQRTKKSWGFIWLLTRNFLAYFFSSLGPHISKKKYETSEFFHMKLKLIHALLCICCSFCCLSFSFFRSVCFGWSGKFPIRFYVQVDIL